jgi:hypothetical protein
MYLGFNHIHTTRFNIKIYMVCVLGGWNQSLIYFKNSCTHYRPIKPDARTTPFLLTNPGYTVSSLNVHQNNTRETVSQLTHNSWFSQFFCYLTMFLQLHKLYRVTKMTFAKVSFPKNDYIKMTAHFCHSLAFTTLNFYFKLYHMKAEFMQLEDVWGEPLYWQTTEHACVTGKYN